MAIELHCPPKTIDAADSLIAITRERVPEGDFRVGEMEVLAYPERAFDMVTVFSFLIRGCPGLCRSRSEPGLRTRSIMCREFIKIKERETGFEPANISLEG